jgi:hypothetical protein
MSVKLERNKSYMKYRYLIFCLFTFLQAEDMTLLAPDGSTISKRITSQRCSLGRDLRKPMIGYSRSI